MDIDIDAAHDELMNPRAKAEMIACHVVTVWLGFHLITENASEVALHPSPFPISARKSKVKRT